MKVEVHPDSVDGFVVEVLKEAQELFNMPCTLPNVSFVEEEEQEYIDKMNEAFALIINYFGGTNE